MAALPHTDPIVRSSFRSVADMWNHRVRSTPDLPAMSYPSSPTRAADATGTRGGRWTTITWREADERVRDLANGLLAHRLQPEDRCALLAATSVTWVIADMAVVCAGGATTTLHPSQTDEECAWILADAGCVLLFCDTIARAERILAHKDALPALARIVVFEGPASADGFVIPLSQIEDEGRAFAEFHPDALLRAQGAIQPGSLATLIYTSGTTGQPKGVELTHDAWVYEAEAIDQLHVLGPEDRQLLVLPLAHVFAKVMQVTFIRLGIPTAIDGQGDRFLQNAAEIRPTWMAAVPRVFEKAYNRVVGEAKDKGPVAWLAFTWALGVGRQVSRLKRANKIVPAPLRVLHAVADRLVFARVREAFGGRLRLLISGGAPLPVDIAEFFDACGILICEGYGLTESGAASCVNTPDDVRFGTVGRPLPGCEVRIDDDGEILLRSRGVMRGYHNHPEDTREALTEDGWLRTGDIGRVLASGHVQITDRKKEIIVTAGGKNVAPARFRNLLRARSPYVSDALVIGDRRNFCTALVALDEDTIVPWARREGLAFRDTTELAGLPEVRELIEHAVDDVDRELAGYEQVRRFAIVPRPFSVEDGTLTPSLKLKRRVIEARYKEIVDRFYEGTIERL